VCSAPNEHAFISEAALPVFLASSAAFFLLCGRLFSGDDDHLAVFVMVITGDE
jgi:hypothetical protein